MRNLDLITIASAAYTATTSHWIAGFQIFMTTHNLWLTVPETFLKPYSFLDNFTTCFTQTTNANALAITIALAVVALLEHIRGKANE